MFGKKKKKSTGAFQYLTVLSLLVILALWCIVTYGGFVSKLFVPSPTAVIEALISMAKDGSLQAKWQSLF